MVAVAGRLRGGSRPAPRGPLPNGAAGARSCESGPLPRPPRPRPRRAAQAREPRAPCGTHHPAGRRGGAPRARPPAGAAPHLPRGSNLRGHGPHEARSTHPEPGAAAPSRGGPRGRGQTRPPPARSEWAGPGKEGNAEAPPVNTRGRSGCAGARRGGRGLRRAAEAMAARGGLGPGRGSRRRRPPDGTEVRKLVRFSRTNLPCWDSRVDKEYGSNICIHLLPVKCQPVIPRELHGPMVHMCAPCTSSRRARRQHPGNTLRVRSTEPLCQGPTNKNL